MSPTMQAILDTLPKASPWVFNNPRTQSHYTVNGARHVFERAVRRAKILTGDVTLHTLRHTALSRMVAQGFDDYTVMEISGHSSTRMLARYTHPTTARKLSALEGLAGSLLGADRVTSASQPTQRDAVQQKEAAEAASFC